MVINKSYTINSDKIAWRILDNEAVILNLDTEGYYSLNEVGTKLWQLISQKVALKNAVDLITSEYDAEKNTIENDLLTVVNELKKEGLIEEKVGGGNDLDG